MKLLPINSSSSFENIVANRFADITVDKIINGENGYAGIFGHIRRAEDLENLCMSHPGNLHLIEKYAELLTYVAEAAWREEKYQLIADCVRKVRNLHSAYPESKELSSIFIFSLIWDAKRTFPIWSGEASDTLCKEYGIEAPDFEKETCSESIDKDGDVCGLKKSCWVNCECCDLNILEDHLKILASDAKTALELYPEEKTAQILYAALLSEIIFDYYWEQRADSVDEMSPWNAEEIYELLKIHYSKYKLPAILEKLIEGSVYLVRQVPKDDFDKREAIRCEIKVYLSEIKEEEKPELYGMYLRLCASEIEDYTENEHLDFCKKIMKEIADQYSQFNDEENIRLAFAESYAGYMLNSGNYTKEECDALYEEVEEKALDYKFSHADKEVFLLILSKIWETYEENGWEHPETFVSLSELHFD
ncbi:MAG TPA: hypothetical protein O0X39_05820 [Methanocorpusculum sp.]|nr:hypothetical protein [Methanocorpusculum sp.]